MRSESETKLPPLGEPGHQNGPQDTRFPDTDTMPIMRYYLQNRFFQAVFLLVFLLAPTAGADDPISGVSSSPEERSRIILQLRWFHQFQFAGYYAAIEKGFYREAGLTVELREGGPGREVVDSLLTGKADYGVTNAEILFYRLHGVPVVAVAAVFQHSPLVLVTRKESGITGPRDLIGRRVKISAASRDVELLAMLQNEGVSLDQFEQLDGWVRPEDYFDPAIDALSGYITNEPYYLIRKGIPVNLIKPSDYGIDFYGDCIFTTEKEIQDHPERVAAFRSASLRGWEYALAHPEEIIDLLIETYGVKKTRDHLRYEAEMVRELVLPELIRIGHLNPGRWRHIAEIFARFRMVPSDYSLEGFLYSPGEKPDVSWLKWIAWAAMAAAALGVFLAAVLLFFNNRLSRAVRSRTFELSEMNEQLLREVRVRKLAEQEIYNLYENLELRIEERTAELLALNNRLEQEIRERQQTEQALRQSEAEKQMIFDSITTHLSFIGPDHRVRWANSNFVRTVGLRSDVLIGKKYDHQWLCSIPCDTHPTEQALRSREHRQGVIHNPDGSAWEIRAKVVRDAGERFMGVLEIADDITDKLRLERQLQQVRQLEAVGKMAGSIAHEFNNALFGITGSIDMLLKKAPDHPAVQQYSPSILEAARRMTRLIDQLLAYARGGKYRPQIISFNRFVEKTLPKIRPVSKERIRVELQPDWHISGLDIEADQVQLQMVFAAVLTNAVEAVGKNGHIRIRTERFDPDPRWSALHPDRKAICYVCLMIEDDGRGMDEKTRDRIFEPFFTTNFKGRGLGLAAVYGIVRNHGGFVEVDSVPGKGTIVRIYLPVVSSCSAAAEPGSPDGDPIEQIAG